MSEILLKVSGLKVAYGGIQAVKGVDFEVREGELVSLIGSNGAGKTTTMKAITGTLPYVDGDILYLGRSIKGRGAWLNGAPMRVSASTDVALMCVGTGLPTPNLSLYPGAYQRLDAIRAPIGAVRIVGSAALSCAFVACGRLTGYYEETGFVDTAAGILMVEEAGGLVTDWWGRGPDHFERSGVLLVANPATHAYLRPHLDPVPPKNPA